jgi:hypothetical protein
MDKKAIIDSLRALALSHVNRSKAACLREMIDELEVTLAAGVTRASVVQTLAANGLEMSLATFETTLKRIRQKRAKPSTSSTQSVGQPQGGAPKPRETTSVAKTENASEGSNSGSYDPQSLNRIMGSRVDLAGLARLGRKVMKREK